MITNRPYLLMRTWTPNSAPVDSSTFDSLRHNRGQLSTMILWYPRLQDAFPTKSGLPHWWPQTPRVQLAPIRSSTLMKKGRIQHLLIKIKSGFTLHLKLRRSTALHIAVTYNSTPSLFLWPPPLFPSKLSFPILCTSKTTHSPYPLLSTQPCTLCLQTGSPGELSQKKQNLKVFPNASHSKESLWASERWES